MRRDLVLTFAGRRAPVRLRFAPGGLAGIGALVRDTSSATRVVVVTDARVDALYGRVVRRSLAAAGLRASCVCVPRGERAKRTESLDRLWRAFAAASLQRADVVVALGGGAVGDLAGFAAATWLRGIAWVDVPTTLLAQVDASVGGKTGIDQPGGKNLVGAFHQPAGVLLDAHVLATLSARERRAGLAEVVKLGMAVDAGLLRWCEREAAALAAGNPASLAEAVRRSVRIKARVVVADEREREGGPRTALNYGHTLGHAIERVMGYRGWRHGEAVALGMRAAAALSVRVVGLSPRALARQNTLLDHLGLPRRIPGLRARDLLSAMHHDKKRSRAGVRWVLTPQEGTASVPRVISPVLVRSVLVALGARG